MKLLFGITILVLVAVSFIADYKWKQWIKTRQQSREQDHDPHSGMPLPQLVETGEPVHPRHPHVHQNHVRTDPVYQTQNGSA